MYLADMTIADLMHWCNEAHREGLCGDNCPASNDVCEIAMKLDEFDWMDTTIPDLEDET